jgi:hypothetical protein
MVGGLSTVAATAPSDKFLYMGGPLAMGFGVIFAASIASGFMNPVNSSKNPIVVTRDRRIGSPGVVFMGQLGT